MLCTKLLPTLQIKLVIYGMQKSDSPNELFKKWFFSWVQCLIPVILATQEAEIGRMAV
jgi:hypothetical protein